MMTTILLQFNCLAERCDVFGCILAKRDPAMCPRWSTRCGRTA